MKKVSSVFLSFLFFLNILLDLCSRYANFIENKDTCLVCIEDEADFLSLSPHTCQFVTLHFMALKSQLHQLKKVFLKDVDTQKTYELSNVLQLFSF